jgi:hypothetical protein
MIPRKYAEIILYVEKYQENNTRSAIPRTSYEEINKAWLKEDKEMEMGAMWRRMPAEAAHHCQQRRTTDGQGGAQLLCSLLNGLEAGAYKRWELVHF